MSFEMRCVDDQPVWLSRPPRKVRKNPVEDAHPAPADEAVTTSCRDRIPSARRVVGIRYSWRLDAHPVETPLAVAPDWLIQLLTLLLPSQPTAFTSRFCDDQRVLDALQRIPADDREVWVKVGMALRGHFGDAGGALWDDRAATSTKYDTKAQARAWRSFRRNGVTLGTIFHLARERARAA